MNLEALCDLAGEAIGVLGAMVAMIPEADARTNPDLWDLRNKLGSAKFVCQELRTLPEDFIPGVDSTDYMLYEGYR